MKIISKGKPASQIKPVRKDSKKSLILLATLKGASIDDLMKVTGWARSAASSAIATDIVPLGYKVKLAEHMTGDPRFFWSAHHSAGGQPGPNPRHERELRWQELRRKY